MNRYVRPKVLLDFWKCVEGRLVVCCKSWIWNVSYKCCQSRFWHDCPSETGARYRLARAPTCMNPITLIFAADQAEHIWWKICKFGISSRCQPKKSRPQGYNWGGHKLINYQWYHQWYESQRETEIHYVRANFPPRMSIKLSCRVNSVKKKQQ